MNTANYISRLLLRHECVIVPNFGGFIAQYRSAEIRTIQGCLLPPSKEISFNRQLISNDGLLISWIAQQERIDYHLARAKVEQWVTVSNKQLEVQGIVSIPDVGKLYLDKEQKLQFQPNFTNHLLAAYGLPTLHLTPIIRQSSKQEIIAERLKQDAQVVPVTNPLRFPWRAIGVAASILVVPLLYWKFVVQPSPRFDDLDTPNREEAAIGLPSNSTNAVSAATKTTIAPPPVSVQKETAASKPTVTPIVSPVLPTKKEVPVMKETTKPAEISEQPTFSSPPPPPPSSANNVPALQPAPPVAIEIKSRPNLKATDSQTYDILLGSYKSADNAKNLVDMLRTNKEGTVYNATLNGYHRVTLSIESTPKDIQKDLARIRDRYSSDAVVVDDLSGE